LESSLIATLFCHIIVAAAYKMQVNAVIAHRAEPLIKICLNCLAVLSL